MATPTLQLPPDVESMTAEEILRFCVETFPGRLSLACSFQKEESVLLDLLFAIDPKARVFAIDTHYLFPETYELWREVEKRYDTKVEVFEGGAGRGQAVGDEARPLPLDREGRAAQHGAARSRLLDHRRSPRPVADARDRRRSSAGTPSTSSGRRTRSPTGATTTAGATSRSAGCRTTRCTTRATSRSATRTRRVPGAGRDGRWAGTRPDGVRAAHMTRRSLASRRPRVRGDPHHARGRCRA